MGIRKYKPTTPGRRGSSVAISPRSPATPRRSRWSVRCTPRAAATCTVGSPPGTRAAVTSGRTGVIDFRRSEKDGVPAMVAHIEYDPNRTARIALLHFADGDKRYIIAPKKLRQGDTVETGPAADIKPGNNLPLRNIPVGTVVHAIELRPGGGAKIARSAGAKVQLVAKDGPYAQLRMPSGEIRNVDVRCRATVGEVGNAEQAQHQLGQGRPDALEGQAPDRPRCRDEPGRSPARRWRGQDLRWSSPGQPGRQARGSHPAAEQGQRRADRPAPAQGRQEAVTSLTSHAQIHLTINATTES